MKFIIKKQVVFDTTGSKMEDEYWKSLPKIF